MILVGAGGCAMLQTALIVVKGTDHPAEFKELSGKRVAVVVRPRDTFQYASVTAGQDIARGVGLLLRKNVRKIEIIDQRRIHDWTDKHDWDDFVDIGEALDADIVVGVDLDRYSISRGSTLHQGQAVVHVSVFDLAEADGAVVFEKDWPDVTFPKSAVPASSMSERSFHAKFVSVLCHKIATLFYKHDGTFDFANDATVLN